MKRLSGIAAMFIAAFVMLSAPATALADGSVGPVYYSNGEVASAAKECEAGDVCATITRANGDQVKVLTGDSGHCNSYVLTFMQYSNGQLVAVWASSTDRNPDSSGMMGAKCGGFRNTHMTIDKVIDMGIFQNTDGKVFVTFFNGSTTPLAGSPPPPAGPMPTPAAPTPTP